MKVIQAKDFSSRSELENNVRNKFGLTTEKKEAIIEGTREELARLHLSDTTVFWGIMCVITDFPTKSSTQSEKPKTDRGPIQPHGLNDNNLKI